MSDSARAKQFGSRRGRAKRRRKFPLFFCYSSLGDWEEEEEEEAEEDGVSLSGGRGTRFPIGHETTRVPGGAGHWGRLMGARDNFH